MLRIAAVAAAAAALLAMLCAPASATEAPRGSWASWNASAIARENGYPVFEAGGKPFFVYGAAFFYERIPRERWLAALQSYRAMGINTIDLYLIWNWHEPVEGAPDFDGRTDPRRDLLGVLALTHELGFKLVLRPGPVIRNEWRNGGYPDWLLRRPAYDMPLHDVLEGRYPATATYQNAHADAAAAQWMNNATHLHYARAWLHDVLSAVEPYSQDVIAVALDDDQGAYIDNDTWPGPNWRAYVGWLRDAVRETVGPRVPLFINAFDMKVTAASPVWAWGDWYQSDAERIGTHDLTQLDFATGLLQTQPQLPVMLAEFQAGWLQGANEAAPRPSDASNTTLALHELLRDGAHGIVDFPPQDTIYPDGWEAPWANWSYAWNAALTYDLGESARYAPTALFGNDVARYGPLLARTHVAADAAIVWPPTLFPASVLTNPDFGAFADATMAMQQDCARRRIACDLVDLRYAGNDVLSRYQTILMPVSFPKVFAARMLPAMRSRLDALRLAGRLASGLAHVRVSPHLLGADDATLLLADDGSYGFVDAINPSDAPRLAGPLIVRLRGETVRLPAIPLPPRSARLVPVHAAAVAIAPADTLVATTQTQAAWQSAAGTAQAFTGHLFTDSSTEIFLQNDRVRVAFGPDAGARVALLQSTVDEGNAATSVGLLRDAVDPEPAPSTRDYIAAYTHPIAAGTFNRPYACTIARAGKSTASVACSYDAPDLPDGGGRFERTLSLAAGSDLLTIDETFTPKDPNTTARLESISGLAFVPGDVAIAAQGAPFAAVLHGHRLAWIRWHEGDVASASLRAERGVQLLALVFAKRAVELQLGDSPAADATEARRLLRANPP